MTFRNREEAGRRIAVRLAHLRGTKPLVLAIPRAAVPMARVVAEALDGDLDVVLVRKIGAPRFPELAIGSVSELGDLVLTPAASALGVDERYLAEETRMRLRTLHAQRQRLAACRMPADPADRVVVVLDDGVATGATMTAALDLVRRRGPKWLVAAAAVAPHGCAERLSEIADDVLFLESPREFRCVSEHFGVFPTVTDDDVESALREFRASRTAPPPAAPSPAPGPLPASARAPR